MWKFYCFLYVKIHDELDYLITKDRAVLHDLFMLTTMQFSKCILLGMWVVLWRPTLVLSSSELVWPLCFVLTGVANAIDLADRFLPKLQSLNCECLSPNQFNILSANDSILLLHIFHANKRKLLRCVLTSTPASFNYKDPLKNCFVKLFHIALYKCILWTQ